MKKPWGSLVDHDPPPLPPSVDTRVANPARVWDYLTGGKDNFAADREAAAAVLAAMPSLAESARLTREFQAAAVELLIGRGVRQFLDIGAGLPSADSVHEIAQRLAPGSRAVYADNDPVVLAHARALLTSSSEGQCSYIEADLREPDKILAQASRTLDLSRPVAVFLIAVLHFIADEDDPGGITARLLRGLRGDAYLAVAHGSADIEHEAAASAGQQYNERSSAPLWLRTRAEVARFFTGTELLGPGVVPIARWWPQQPGEDIPSDEIAGHVGIGRRPARS
jgi:SAM-dependent methyltransferase